MIDKPVDGTVTTRCPGFNHVCAVARQTRLGVARNVLQYGEQGVTSNGSSLYLTRQENTRAVIRAFGARIVVRRHVGTMPTNALRLSMMMKQRAVGRADCRGRGRPARRKGPPTQERQDCRMRSSAFTRRCWCGSQTEHSEEEAAEDDLKAQGERQGRRNDHPYHLDLS